MKSREFAPFPFDFECCVCGKRKNVYASKGFACETENVRERQRACSDKCLRALARELQTDLGISDYNLMRGR